MRFAAKDTANTRASDYLGVFNPLRKDFFLAQKNITRYTFPGGTCSRLSILWFYVLAMDSSRAISGIVLKKMSYEIYPSFRWVDFGFFFSSI